MDCNDFTGYENVFCAQNILICYRTHKVLEINYLWDFNLLLILTFSQFYILQ